MFHKDKQTTNHYQFANDDFNVHHGRTDTDADVPLGADDLYVNTSNAWFPDFYATDEIDLEVTQEFDLD